MIGTEINGRYFIESELGRGGMGVVYRGRDLLLKRPLAIKVVGSGVLGTEGRARLLREAQAAASLNHPNIVAVYDAGEVTVPGHDGPATFVVMELVAGQTLRDIRPADVAESVAILEQICAALAAAHAQGIIHRDLKPENVIRSEDGLVKLMDFGLARTLGRTRLTQEGTFLGTFDYLAPEIIQGQAASAQSDLYALGVLAYELLAGRRPFEAETPAGVLSQHLHAPVTPPSAFNSDIPPSLDHLLIRLLSKRPDGRPASAAAVGQALKEAVIAIPDRPALVTGPQLDLLVRGRLVGRERELVEGMALWQLAAGESRQVLLISGEPGIGKTRLATEICVQAQLSGARLLQGQCYENGGLPYMPLAQMIRAAVQFQETPTLAPDLLAGLRRIAPDIGHPVQAAAPEPDPGSEEAEAQLYESFVTLCQLLARQRPLLLFFDDLHWADSGSLAVVRHLVRRLANAPLMILATYREIELSGRRPARQVLDDLRREAGAQRLKLARFDRAGTEALLATLFAEEITPEFLEAIFRETEGNPFFVEELCKTLVESGQLTLEGGRWQRPAMEEIRLPQSIQMTIESRLERLDDRTVEVLRAAAMLGRQFRYELLRAAAQLQEAELVEALEWAMRAQLIREIAQSGPATGPQVAFSFTHALIQATLLNGLGKLRRPLLARSLAQELEESSFVKEADVGLLLGRLFAEAGDGVKAVPYLLQAGEEARSVFAYDEALAHYEQALLFLRQGDDLDGTARALMTLGATALKAGRFEKSRRAYDEAFALWRRAPREVAQVAGRRPAAKRPFRCHTREPVTLDPARSMDSNSAFIIRQLFEGLVALGPADEILPAAAASWEILEGGRRYLFHLREAGVWSDGQPVTAVDFEYAWRRLFDPQHNERIARVYSDIQGAREYLAGQSTDRSELGIKAIDRLTLQIDLERPVVYFLHLAAVDSAVPVPRHVVEAHGSRWTETDTLVSNGPFVLEAWEKGRQITLTRNPLYRGTFSGNLERVELNLVNDEALLEEYAAGRLDCLYLRLLPTAVSRQAWRRFGADLFSTSAVAAGYLAFNCARPPLDDPRVRRAIALAIDRRRLSEEIEYGLQGPVNSGFIPPGLAGHGLLPEPAFDPDRARQLLVEAGYPDGRGLPHLTCLEISSPGETESHMAWIRDRLREELGLELEVRPASMEEILAYHQEDERQLWYLGWTADYTDPDSFMRAGDWTRVCNWPNEHYVKLVEEARLELDQDRRMELYRQAESIFREEAPLMPTLYGRWHILIKPWVRRLATSPTVWTIFKDTVLGDDG